MRDHADPREHIHRGPEHSMTGSYGLDLMMFQFIQWHDAAPGLSFAGAGDWPVLDLDQVDELVEHMAVHLERLQTLRAQMAELAAEHTARWSA